MNIKEMGEKLFKNGEIMQDEIFYKNGWKHILIIKYNHFIYWVKMSGECFLEIEKIF